MASRFYLSSTRTPAGGITPGFAAWTRNTEGDRREMIVARDGSALTNKTVWAGGAAAANDTALCRQYISPPMAGGIGFTTSDTIKGVVQAIESALNDNINRQPICLKVYAADGTTLQATLFALAHAGPTTTEWVVTPTFTNRQIADGDTLATNYTTTAGDRLVLEIGGQVSGAAGTSVTGTMRFGAASATDLSEDQTGTASDNPWFEISRDVTFLAPQDDASGWFAGAMASFAPMAFAASLVAVGVAINAGMVGSQPQDDLPAQAVVSAGHQGARFIGPVVTPVQMPAPWRWHQEDLAITPPSLAGDEGTYLLGLPPAARPLDPLGYPQDELAFPVDEAGYQPPLPAGSVTPTPVYHQDELAILWLDEGEYQPPVPAAPLTAFPILPPDDVPPQAAPFGLDDGGGGPRFVATGTAFRASYPAGGASGAPPSTPLGVDEGEYRAEAPAVPAVAPLLYDDGVRVTPPAAFGLDDDSGAYLGLALGFGDRTPEPTLYLDASDALPGRIEDQGWIPPAPALVPATALPWWMFDGAALPVAPTPFGLSEDAYRPPTPEAVVVQSPVPPQVDLYPTPPAPLGVDEGQYLASAPSVDAVQFGPWDDGSLPIAAAPVGLDEGAWFPGLPVQLVAVAAPVWDTGDRIAPPAPLGVDEGEYRPPLFLVPAVVQPIWLSFDGAEPGNLTSLLALTAYDFSGARYVVTHYSGGVYVAADHSHPALEVT